MKRLFITLFSIYIAITMSFAQKADVQVGELINTGNWFELERVYPAAKDDIQTPLLNLMAEVMLASNFNRPDELREKLPKLIAEHQAELGFENVCNLTIMGAIVEGFNGNYGVAADMIGDIANAVKSATGSLEGIGIEELWAYYDVMRQLPAPALEKPDSDVMISFSEISGTLLWLPVCINDKTYNFILDTGASTSLISNDIAKEIGAYIIGDSIFVGGATGGGNLQRTFIKEMNIGSISFKNVLTFVNDNSAPAEVPFKVDAVLGMDFIERLGEIQIDMADMTLIIPAQKTALPEYGRNILLDRNIPIIEAIDGMGNRMTFTLDTGHSSADLSDSWFSMNTETASTLPIETENIWGHGGTIQQAIVKVPEYTISIGDMPITFYNISAFVPNGNEATSPRDGNLGMELLKKCTKLTINFDEMFVKLE